MMITIDADLQDDPDKIPDSADFRLMSNRAVHALLKYSERNLFLRGLVPQLGFQAGKVYCIRLVFIDAFTLVYRRCSALTAFDSVSCPTDIFKTRLFYSRLSLTVRDNICQFRFIKTAR